MAGAPTRLSMDTAPHDEVGTPAEEIEHCDAHDVLYRAGGECLECVREGEN